MSDQNESLNDAFYMSRSQFRIELNAHIFYIIY